MLTDDQMAAAMIDRLIYAPWTHSLVRRRELSHETCTNTAEGPGKNLNGLMGKFSRFFWGSWLDELHDRTLEL